MRPELETLARQIVDGAPRALARGLTWIESGGKRAEALCERLYSHTGRAQIVGVTGAPGSGKSTLVRALALLASTKDRGIGPRLKAAASLANHGSKRRDRDALDVRLSIVASLIRDLGALSAGVGDGLANADLEDTLRRLAPAFDARRLANAFGIVTEAQDALSRNASPKLVADWVAVTI